MNKLYLLPISLVLLNPGFTTEFEGNPPSEVQVPIVEETQNKNEVVLESKGPIGSTEKERFVVPQPVVVAPSESQEKNEEAAIAEAAPHAEKRERPKVSLQPLGTHVPQTEAVQPEEQVIQPQPSQPAKAPQAQAEAVKPSQPIAPQAQARSDKPATAKSPQAQAGRTKPAQRPGQAKPSKRQPTKKPNVSKAEPKKVAQNNKGKSQTSKPSNAQSTTDSMMYNTGVRPMTKNAIGMWVMGDALLWQAVEENLTYIMSGNDINGATNRDLHTVDFNWDWGFRVAAGYNATRDGWDIGLTWTHIRNTAHGHKDRHAPKNTLYQVWTDTAHRLTTAQISEAKSHWHANLDQVDLNLGRQFYVGRYLTLRPFVGMRSTWLFQEYDVKLTGSTGKNETDMKNRFWGYGFTAGFDTDWRFGRGFSLYGSADMSLLLGFFDVDQKGTQNDIKIWSNDKSFRAGRAVLDIDLGLKWCHLFCEDSFGLTLKAGYEYHLYFNQNQFLLPMGSTAFELRNPAEGNLIYQGVIGSIQFDF